MDEIINYHVFKSKKSDSNTSREAHYMLFSTRRNSKGKDIPRTFYYDDPTDLGPSLVRQIQNDHRGGFPMDIRYSLSPPASGSVHEEGGRLKNLIYEELNPDERDAFLNSLGAELEKINDSNTS